MFSPKEILAQSIKNRRAVLFVGAGVSMSVGLPSWQLLADHMLEELDLDRSVMDGLSEGYQMLAEFYCQKQGAVGPLRSWMDRNWKVSREAVAKSDMHRTIVEMNFPIIYTTNYDRNLEVAFEVNGRRFIKIANAKDLANAADDVTQIIKYHGDFDDDASLVLTETDFMDRLAFDSPLDAKFRADALGRPILFIGYSMSDPNIRLLLHRIWQTWKRSGYESDRPRSFIFMQQTNPLQEALFERWGITALTAANKGKEEEQGDSLLSFLREIKSAIQQDRR